MPRKIKLQGRWVCPGSRVRLPITRVAFVRLSDLVPAECRGFVFERLSENAPFSWGDNNRSLVRLSRLLAHARSVFSATPLAHEFVRRVEHLASKYEQELYVDLET